MNRPLRLAFLGGGINSAVGRCHQVASRLDNRWELVSGAFSRDPEINEATGTIWGLSNKRIYKGLESFLEGEKDQVDAVAVLTPTPQHFEHISALIEAGFDVISEKALANTSAEGDALHNLAQKSERFLGVTMNYSGYPMVRELRRMIRDEELGAILAVQIEMPQEGFLRKDSSGRQVLPQDWRQQDGPVPTVSLDLGTHTHHLLTFLLGEEPVRVVGTQAHHGDVPYVADYVSCLAKMPNETDVTMWFGKCSLGNRNGLAVRIYGDKASAQWIQKNPEELLLASPIGQITIVDRASPGIIEASANRYQRFKAGHPAGFIEAFSNLYWDLADDLIASREGSEKSGFTADAKQATRGLHMLEAIVRSSVTGKWQEISQAEGESHQDS